MFKYDIHVHCTESSKCAHAPARDLVHAYKNGGYAGFVMTNHFTDGELDVAKYGSWEKATEYHTRGYYLAKDEAEKIGGIDVFFGFEFRFKGHDFLIYGIDEKFILAHPDIFGWDFKKFANEIHAAGGYICQAHPMRPLSNGEILMYPSLVDAMEIYNGSHVEGSPYPPIYNSQAEAYAGITGITGLAGSDTHDVSREGLPYRKASVILEKKAENIFDLINAFKEERFTIWKK